jgi:hypothetical protein
MIDQTQSRAIPAQSSAIVLSALITTWGVVLAACIQKGWIEKPAPAVFVLPQPSSPIAKASFTGAIEALPEVRQACAMLENDVNTRPTAASYEVELTSAREPGDARPVRKSWTPTITVPLIP